jgi:hypothetical protein
MPSSLRYLFWLESTLGLITGMAAIITLFWQDWIEAVFGVDPDGGNGSAEWLVVFALLLITVALAVGARHEWRRARLAGSS